MRACLTCGRLTAESYCKKHRVHEYAHPLFRANRARKMEAHEKEHPPSWCPGAPDLDHDPHHLEKGDVLTVDHRIPLQDGGGHHLSNLRVMCRSMNSRRR